LYGLTGISNLKALSFLMASGADAVPAGFGLIAVVFVMAGLGFNVAAVPFHFYAPDVYQGSPTVLAALLAWVPKAIGFVAMLRALTAVLGGASPIAEKAMLLAWVLAVVTMTLGNTVALLQDNLKRLLAYSSIAHAGYVLIGVTVAFRDLPRIVPPGGASAAPTLVPYLGGQGVVFYLAAYALMTLGFFAVLLLFQPSGRPVETVDDLAGLSRTHPTTALALALCLFSLAGVPPLAGFWGKFQIFAAALRVDSPDDSRMFQILALIGVLNAAVGAYYYLRIVVVMYLRAPAGAVPVVTSAWPTAFSVAACAGLSLLFGLVPEPLNTPARRAGESVVSLPEPRPVPVQVTRVDSHRVSGTGWKPVLQRGEQGLQIRLPSSPIAATRVSFSRLPRNDPVNDFEP
jgi:NADH-quinone oxidoreductase subunit N